MVRGMSNDLPFELFIAFRYLLAKRKQAFIALISFISVIGVMVGVMAVLIALALMTGLPGELRERIGISLQETQLNEKLTVYETLRLFRSFYRSGPMPDELLHDLSLEEKRDARVGKLSGGQKQRLAVACALIGDPDILFLDEPTTGLDPQSRLQLWEVVARFRKKGGTILLTTHYMDEAERCHRLAFIFGGRLLDVGTPGEIVARRKLFAAELHVSEPNAAADALRGDPDVDAVAHYGHELRLTTRDTDPLQVVERVLGGRGIGVLSARAARVTVEDAFVSMVRAEQVAPAEVPS
jgi:ABC-2 type transport system ATP-binding protein